MFTLFLKFLILKVFRVTIGRYGVLGFEICLYSVKAILPTVCSMFDLNICNYNLHLFERL